MPKLIGWGCAQPAIMEKRQRVVPRATGDVLELGCGGGINIPLYDPAKLTSFSGLDPSPALLDSALMAAQARGMTADIRAGVGEFMPYADASFDTVLCTYTLCSVHDQARVLAEMRRVLRPGGTVLFLEHGAAPDEGPARWQRRIEPVWRRLAGNCHMTRPIAAAYRAAGFTSVWQDGGYAPDTPRPFGWMEWGEARI